MTKQLQLVFRDKQHVIWDWNGTLLDDVDFACSVVNSLLVEHDLPILDLKTYRDLFEFPVINFYKRMGFDFSKSPFDMICHDYVERFMEGIKSVPLIPEMKSILHDLHLQGVSQSVLSATDQENLNGMISHFELEKLFRFVFGIENKFAASKIQRGRELLEAAGFRKSETIIVGDTLHDLEVAKELGVDVVLLAHGHQNENRLRAVHDLVLPLGN